MFGIDLPGILNAALGANAAPATLIKVTPGTRVPGNVASGSNPTTASYAAQGYLDDFDSSEIDGTAIVVGDRKIVLYGASIASGQAPVANDKIVIGGATYRVRSVTSDPANAIYTCVTHGPALP